MKQEQLNAIKERVAKATPGEWKCINIGRGKSNYAVVNEEEYVAHAYDVNDTEFIAHARIDVPALVTEVERLQKALEKVMDAEEPIMEGTKGWETRSYEIARQALGGEAHE
ncbi:hypothetical protein CNQ87_15310 [Lysinibacillus fusiformis]|uniref:hypothetical protein n=1 Tax=Lysinibacillus fusiformis TaxID=28031 RepID=UPI000BBB3897|nr:hypothetical protein [Lysinibacillus fusiformis]PCD81974.1 hypothetical protein CNQ87_15310 [Lysinibacillus fusiformis]